MRCKNCGGELLFQEGKSVCQNCGAILTIDYVHESIDVYICYIENDASGRRTKDSIIAQEVYEKLKAAKISAFYERISADGVVGEDLEAARYAAVQKAKTVLVLGASPENFQAIVEKYGSVLEQKIVIPFCVDVNPGAIPKTINKIQAINYSTIGWDQDLVKGLYNLMGKEKELDTKSLFGKAKKKRISVICAAAAMLLILLAAILFFTMSDSGGSNTETQLTTQATEPSSEQEPTTETGPSPSEIYAQASTAMEEGKLVEALKLFSQIPEHKDSSNKIKLIYAKFEGYYKTGDVSLRLDVADNLLANVEVTIVSKSNIVRFSVGTTILEETIAGDYRDNNEQTGTLELILEDSGLRLTYGAEGESEMETWFALAEKSDEPFLQVNREMLLSWLEAKLTLSQIRQKGYEMEQATVYDRAGDNLVYKVKDAEIYLSMFASYSGESVLIGVQAPAWILAPDYIGSENAPFWAGSLIYWPNGFMTAFSEDIMSFYPSTQSSEEIISEDTLIGITSKEALTKGAWDNILTDIVTTRVELTARKKYGLQPGAWCSADIVTENDTHILLAVNTEKLRDAQKRAWYKFDKKPQKVSFIKEGPWKESGNNNIAKDLWFSEYLDFAVEFPELFGNYPGTTAWDEVIEGIILDKVSEEVSNRYPQDANEWITRETIAQNDKHFLICVQTQSLRNQHMCAWYECNKKDGTVAFVKEGPYATDGYQFSKVLWFKEYSDFAEEFPKLYSSFREAISPYLGGIPYGISIDSEYYLNPNMPEYEYDYAQWLSAGSYVIVEERYDEDYNLWGRLESGEGWVCLTEIWECAFWGYN